MNFPIPNRLRLFSKSLALCACLASAATAQTFSSPPPEIVSAWKLNGENSLAVFTHDGNFFTMLGDPESPGMERGTFTWDKDTGEFSAETIVDTNGAEGFSHPDGATSISITGDNLSYTVANEGTSTFTRITNTASAIVGSWYVPGVRVTLTFLGDGTYYLAQDANEVPDGYDGIERGTYTWNSTTKKLTASPSVDTNADYGLSSLTASATANISGNSMTLTDGSDTTNLRRITPLASPPIASNDFEVGKGANYRQTSNASPVLLAVPAPGSDADFPFSGDAYFTGETLPGVPPLVPDADEPNPNATLSITGNPVQNFTYDIDGGYSEEGLGWTVLTDYSSLSALNSAFPNSASYIFTLPGGSATLTFPSGATFESAPKIQIGGGAWSGGRYLLGTDQTLQWSPQTVYDPGSLVTVLTVIDQNPGPDEDAIFEDVIQGDVTSYDFSGKIESGHTYDVVVEHVRITGSTTSGTGVFAGRLGYSLYNTNTRFEMVAPGAELESQLISEQPVSQAGIPGAPLVLSVGISRGAYPFTTFQWFRNDVEIIGQTGNSLYIPSFDPNVHTGKYRVSADHPEGFEFSNIASLGNAANETRAIQNLVIYKRKISQQQSPTLLSDFGAAFDARVEGFEITGTFPASSISLRKPDNSTVALALDGDHWDAETDFASLPALQSSFPDGTYAINIGADSIPINMSTGSYPNQPLVTSNTGTWVNGKLRITASQAAAGFTLTTNSTNGNGFVTLSVIDIATDNDIVYEDANTDPISPSNRTFLTVAISPGLLTVGQAYEVEAEFDNVIDTRDVSQNSWASHIANAFGLLSTTTVFNIEVVADPSASPYTDWQSGFFNPTQLADPAISGDDADSDNDGLDNLLEFVLGGSPTANSAGLLKTATTTPAAVGRNLVFFYDRKTTASAVNVVIETSPSLTGTWTPAIHGTNNVTITTAPLDANTQRVTATIPTTEPKLFVRLKATR